MIGSNYNTVNGYNHIKQVRKRRRTVVRNPGESTEKKAGRKSSLPNARHAKNNNIRTVQTKTYLLSGISHRSQRCRIQGAESRTGARDNAYKDAGQNNGKVLSST